MFQLKKCFLLATILLMVFGSSFSLTAQCVRVENLDTSECFNTIQEAIDDNDTDTGDTIYVNNGDYEEQILINKSIILEGASQWSVRIKSDSTPGIIQITADNVIIRNVGVFWTGSFSAFYHGIKIESDNCVLDNIIVGDCPRNIYIYGGSGNTISNSLISTVFENHESVTIIGSQNIVCGNTIISSADIIGYGIVLVGGGATQNQIIGNIIQNHEYGIYLFSAYNNSIYYNNFYNNSTHAFTFYTSPYNTWDNGAAYGGNYWGTCADNDCDGYCDTAYTIDTGEVDNYPLAKPSIQKCQ